MASSGESRQMEQDASWESLPTNSTMRSWSGSNHQQSPGPPTPGSQARPFLRDDTKLCPSGAMADLPSKRTSFRIAHDESVAVAQTPVRTIASGSTASADPSLVDGLATAGAGPSKRSMESLTPENDSRDVSLRTASSVGSYQTDSDPKRSKRIRTSQTSSRSDDPRKTRVMTAAEGGSAPRTPTSDNTRTPPFRVPSTPCPSVTRTLSQTDVGAQVPSTPSAVSTRRARPPPGSPVFQFLQAQREMRAGSPRMTGDRTNVTPKNKALEASSSPLAREIAPPASSPPPPPEKQPSPDSEVNPISEERLPGIQERFFAIQVAQLKRYTEHNPTGSLPASNRDFDEMSEAYPFRIYNAVFIACMLHAIDRPLDPGRLLFIAHPSSLADQWKQWPDLPPTHMIWLAKNDPSSSSWLFWGHFFTDETGRVGVDVAASSDRVTDLEGQPVDVESVLAAATRLIKCMLAPGIRLRRIDVRSIAHLWSPAVSRKHTVIRFCQLISAVVHRWSDHTPSLHSSLPVFSKECSDAERRTKLLMRQLSEGQLSLATLTESGLLMPENVLLHTSSDGSDPLEAAAPLLPTEEQVDGSWQQEVDEAEEEGENEGENEEDQEDQDGTDQNWDKTLFPLDVRCGMEHFEEKTTYMRAWKGVVQYGDQPWEEEQEEEEEEERVVPLPCSVEGSGDDSNSSDTRTAFEKVALQLRRDRAFSHTSRLAHWQRLKRGKLNAAAVSCLLQHLWLSACLGGAGTNVLLLDPELVNELLELGEALEHISGVRTGRCEETEEAMRGVRARLLGREELWPRMRGDCRVLALCHTIMCHPDEEEERWVTLDMRVVQGQVVRLDFLIPPGEIEDRAGVDKLVGAVIGALSCVLPGGTLVAGNRDLEEQVHRLVIPRPAGEDGVALAMIAYACAGFLSQPHDSLDVSTFRQAACYYFNLCIRPRITDIKFPWVALIDEDGLLRLERNKGEVDHLRFALAANEHPPLDIFPRTRPHAPKTLSADRFVPFFEELELPESIHQPDMLIGCGGRDGESLQNSLCLGLMNDWPLSFDDAKLQTRGAYSIGQFVDLLDHLGGPESEEAGRLLLTGTYQGEHVVLDWLKDAYALEADWLLASTDVDSLTLTRRDAPVLRQAGNYHPYPNRALSINKNVDIQIEVGGEPVDMHTCPNFCVMTLGGGNQFRLLVFLPDCREKVGRLWRNKPRSDEMRQWYQIFCSALRILRAEASEDWQHVLERTIEALPASYEIAELQTTRGGARSFVGYRIEPAVLNEVFPLMRRIVDSRPELAKLRGFFFHLVGINLKLATQTIRGREQENPLNYAFRIYDFIDWSAENPHDITADVGWTVNVHSPSAPEEIKRATLLARTDPFCELLRPAFKSPQRDRYCHSYVVGGLRAKTRAAVRKTCGMLKLQVYQKDMVLTYRHREKSLGANFTVKEALGLSNGRKFRSEMEAFQGVMRDRGSYGVRAEWRSTAWGANRAMRHEPGDFLDRFLQAETIVCHPTAAVCEFKTALSRGWSAILNRQAALEKKQRKDPESLLLASVLTYWLKGLVMRPDEQAESADMAHSLDLLVSGKLYGLPFMRAASVDPCGLRVSYLVPADTFPILRHAGVIVPGRSSLGSRKRAFAAIQTADPLATPPASPGREPDDTPQDTWSGESTFFVTRMASTRLAESLWRLFPQDRLIDGTRAAELRRKPLTRAKWPFIVEPLNELQVQKAAQFPKMVDMLLPPNWRHSKAQSDFQSFDASYLSRIREHLESVPAGARASYSARLRRELRTAIMDNWGFLPSMQANRIWTYKLEAGARHYRICPRHT